MAERYPCPQCGRENDITQRFCGACGRPLVLTCVACGATSPLDFKFCGSCGAGLRASKAPRLVGEERKIVTVLFADLVDFTARAERLDPEDVRAILAPYYVRLRNEIEAFGGSVEKFIGDAVMGVFGAPVAHGDDPERAVRAALSIQAAIGEMNEADHARNLQVRIAVNTGEVIVALGAQLSQGEAMVTGDVVNTAARLQTAAPVNSILVGEETYVCTRSVIQYERVESVEAKGKQAPVPAWRALSAIVPPGERAPKRTPLIDREQEMTILATAWERVLANKHVHLVTIFGVPGVGKSRLALEFATSVAARGGQTIRGRSLPYGGSSPYSAFAQQVKEVAHIFDSDPAAVAWEKLRESVTSLLGQEEGDEVASHIAMLLGIGPHVEADRQSIFFSARRLVEAIAAKQPTVLLFEDIHASAPSLLDLIDVLASRIRDTPLLILTLARPDLMDQRPSWGAGMPIYTALQLEPLDEKHSRRLAERLIERTSGRMRAQVSEIARLGEGNPLFIEELVASISERAAQTSSELPTGIRGIVASRLDALPQLERSVLLNASVMGRFFWREGLARLGAYTEPLPLLLDALEARDLIRRDSISRLQGQHQFRFKHMVIRDVAYSILPRAKRKEAHAIVASFLNEVMSATESPALLGPHWREAGELEKAVDCFFAAGDQASRGWAKAEAVNLYREALKLVPESDQEKRKKIRLRLAVAQQMLYHLPDAERLRAESRPG